jgi:arylformamidase
VIDISQPLGEETAVWPGDQPFELAWSMRRDRGDSVDVATVRMSVHSGTHVDGPRHVADGLGAGELALGPFVGPAVVVDARARVTGDPPLVPPSVLDGLDAGETPRVLLRTRDRIDPEEFPEEFAALDPELARRLVAEGFILVGTDAPSVDPVDSTSLETHRILAAAGVPNVENLVLSGVVPGRYTFIGLPLKLRGADSAPVRAVLLPDEAGGA